MMTEKPILFSGPMVRAILDGRKTMTRRVLKAANHGPGICFDGFRTGNVASFSYVHGGLFSQVKVPYSAGDTLWVREAWQTGSTCNGPQISYRATPDFFEINAWDGLDEGIGPSFNYDRCPGANFDHWLSDVLENDGPWRPSIHMPRWASRITLKVTGVKVERLQDISEEDAKAEGIERLRSGRGYYDPRFDHGAVHMGYCATAKDAFSLLWQSINGPGSWDANPWVAAISFERLK